MKRTLLISCLSVGLVGSALAYQEFNATARVTQQVPVGMTVQDFIAPQSMFFTYRCTGTVIAAGAPGGSGAVTGGISSRLRADDCTPIAATTKIYRVYDAVQVTYAGTQPFRMSKYLWADNGSGAPGTAIAKINYNWTTLAGGFYYTFTSDWSSFNLSLPAGTYWEGTSFDNNDGAYAITAADLNLCSIMITNPATQQFGTSADSHWRTTVPYNTLASNPAGIGVSFGAGFNNFYWGVTDQAPKYLHGKVNIPSCAGADLSGKTAHIYARETVAAGGLAIVDETVTLAADGSFTFTAEWPNPGGATWNLPNTYDIKVHVDGWLDKVTTDVAVDNDCALVTVDAGLPGDCGPDNVVDLGDFDIFAAAFGSEVGDFNYNSLCDWDCNGVIDLGDFDLFAASFGFEGDN